MAASTVSHLGSSPSARGTTRLDRVLLRAASVLAGIALARLERRVSAGRRHALSLQSSMADERRAAEALGAIGMPPR